MHNNLNIRVRGLPARLSYPLRVWGWGWAGAGNSSELVAAVAVVAAAGARLGRGRALGARVLARVDANGVLLAEGHLRLPVRQRRPVHAQRLAGTLLVGALQQPHVGRLHALRLDALAHHIVNVHDHRVVRQSSIDGQDGIVDF